MPFFNNWTRYSMPKQIIMDMNTGKHCVQCHIHTHTHTHTHALTHSHTHTHTHAITIVTNYIIPCHKYPL